MKKEGFLTFLFLLIINFVSAYSYSLESSIRELGEFIDTSTLILVLVFVILFWISFKIFTKIIGEEHRGSSGVLSFIISFFLIWLINRTDLIMNIEDFWDYLGYSEGILSMIVPVIIIIIILYLIIKIGYLFFLFSGIGLIGICIFTDYIYQEGFVIGFGILLILISLYLWNRKRKIEKGIQPENLKAGKLIKWLLFIAGIVLLFFNYILAGIIFILWLLIILFTRNKTDRFYDKRIPLGGMAKGIGRGTGKVIGWGSRKTLRGAKAIGKRYDWEKEKRQGRWFKEKAKATGGWFGKKAKKEWQKEKEVMKERKKKYDSWKEKKKIEKARLETEKETKRREEEMQEQKKTEEKKKFNLARKIGIKKLERKLIELKKDYQKGIEYAEELHKKATKLGWTKAGVRPRKGETNKQTENRAAEASEAYRAWYRRYNRNISLEKQIKEIEDRIEHLKKQLKR